MVFTYALLAVTIVSLLSLLGAVFISLQRKFLDSFTTYMLAFSSGILLGTTFYDLIPEGYEGIQGATFTYVIIGFVTFFILEKLIHWHHHKEDIGGPGAKKHVAYLTLIGDGMHNFLDGAIIAVTFLTSIPLGIMTTIAVIAHEIPHELGDFFLLTYGGFTNKKALWYNFLSAITAVIGTVFVFLFSESIVSVAPYAVGFAAGNFLYIAASDLIPELHEKRSVNTSIAQIVCLVGGIILMRVLTQFLAA